MLGAEMLDKPSQVNISVPQSMKEWLDGHPEINKSDLFREAVKEKMGLKKKVDPWIYFVAVIGTVVGVSLIGIGLTPVPMYQSIRAVLPILGGILAVSVAVYYYKASHVISRRTK